jgi:hypothetical protein
MLLIALMLLILVVTSIGKEREAVFQEDNQSLTPPHLTETTWICNSKKSTF